VAPSTNGRYKALPSLQHKRPVHLLRVDSGLLPDFEAQLLYIQQRNLPTEALAARRL